MGVVELGEMRVLDSELAPGFDLHDTGLLCELDARTVVDLAGNESLESRMKSVCSQKACGFRRAEKRGGELCLVMMTSFLIHMRNAWGRGTLFKKSTRQRGSFVGQSGMARFGGADWDIWRS